VEESRGGRRGNTHGKQGSPNKIIGLSVLQDVIKGDHGDDASKNTQHWKNESEGWYAWIRCCEDGIEDNQNWDLTSVKKYSKKIGKNRINWEKTGNFWGKKIPVKISGRISIIYLRSK
jgi:hypothetical protein